MINIAKKQGSHELKPDQTHDRGGKTPNFASLYRPPARMALYLALCLRVHRTKHFHGRGACRETQKHEKNEDYKQFRYSVAIGSDPTVYSSSLGRP